jgi:C4-dicarboxylate-specific signal transduction histidine kinase
MNEPSNALAVEGVRFFGAMSASISHELKNVLAIINENAGLLEDMVRMVEKGIPLSPERLFTMARSMTRQVSRGDRIVQGMNRFAHSADEADEAVDVGELIRFMVRLTDRLIRMKGNPPLIDLPAAPLTVTTNRFYLENLVWACLDRALDACGPGDTVSIRADRTQKAVRVRFCGLPMDPHAVAERFPSPREKMVADLLGARLSVEGPPGHISMIFGNIKRSRQ